ncbi:MAG: HD domain-containing phosphohydrolase [Alphaproteobacteria bacterium]|nr:HD domain-containing phosphohydrolase [Alphaproteobacteria bacterium]
MVHEITPLEKSDMRYRRLFETARDGILILSCPEGRISDANPFLTEMLGYTLDELIGKRLWEIGAVTEQKAAPEAFPELITKGYIRCDDLPLRRKDGTIIHVEMVSTIYNVGSERVVQCNLRDIAERKLAEKQLQEYQNSFAISMHEMVNTLSTLVDQRDPYTAGHQARVSDLSVQIATQLGLPAHTIEGIRMGAMVHDIGKVAIPAEILTKPTKLNSFETEMLKNHVQAGYDILKHIHFPWPVAQIVLQHHERLDGSGYPNGLKGDSICEEARIIAIADCVEAMAGDRPYRTAPGMDAALEMLEADRGILFDFAAAQACLKLFREEHYAFNYQHS